MRRTATVLFLAFVVMAAMATAAFASSVHLKGGARAEPAFTDGGLFLEASGALAGLGNGDVIVNLDGAGDSDPRRPGLSQLELDRGHHRPGLYHRHDHRRAAARDGGADRRLHLRPANLRRSRACRNGELHEQLVQASSIVNRQGALMAPPAWPHLTRHLG